MDSLEAIRVLNFDGSEEKWPEWSKKFKAFMTMKKQRKYLSGDYGVLNSVQMKLPSKSEYETIRFKLTQTTSDKEKIKLYKENDKTYNHLLLSVSGTAFDIIQDAVTTEQPEGNAKLAWQLLTEKYRPKDLLSVTELKKEYDECYLSTKNDDPSEFFVKFREILRRLRTQAGKIIDEDDQISHILGKLGDDYSEVHTTINVYAIENPTSVMTMDKLEKLITSFWKRKYSKKVTKNTHTALLTTNMGNLDVEKAKAARNKSRQEFKNGKLRFDPGPWIEGNCTWCGSKHHMESFCGAKKKGLPKGEKLQNQRNGNNRRGGYKNRNGKNPQAQTTQ